MLTDSSRLTRSAESAAMPPGPLLIHSAGSSAVRGSIGPHGAPAGPVPGRAEPVQWPAFPGRICHQFDETPRRTVRLACRLTVRGAVSSYC